MLHASTKRLIDKLSEMTFKHRVEWAEGDDGQIIHDTEGYRVTLTPAPCAVILSTTDGKEIEICSPEDLAEEVTGNGMPYAQFVASLYEEASRDARGAEKAIAALMKGLESADADAVTPDVEPAPPAEDVLSDVSVLEDPGDESSRLPSEANLPDDETHIQKAVANLAEQVNAPVEEGIEEEVETGLAETAEADPSYTPAFIGSEDIGGDYTESADIEAFDAVSPVETAESGTVPPAPSEAEEPVSTQPAVDEFADPADSYEPTATLSAPISLSGISAGFGLGVPGEVIAEPVSDDTSDTNTPMAAAAPEKIIIDGTADLPEWTGEPQSDDSLEADSLAQPISQNAPDFESAETIAAIEPGEDLITPPPAEVPVIESEAQTPESEEAPPPATPFNPWN